MSGHARGRSIDQREPSAHETDSSDAATSQASSRDPTTRTAGNRQQERTPDGRRFLFIDANADRSTSSEAVRVHVMREAHRHRREKRGIQGQSQSRRMSTQDEMVILDLRNTSRPTSKTPPGATTTEHRSSAATPVTAIDWPTVIQAGIAPFLIDSLQHLYCLAEGYLRSIRLVQPDVLHLCRGDFLSMSAYLALAALQLASGDQEPANVASVQFEARALELLRLRITHSTKMHTDTTIVAVLLLSQLEQHKDNAQSALFHRNALQRLVQDRGGLDALREQNAELGGIIAESGFVEIVGQA